MPRHVRRVTDNCIYFLNREIGRSDTEEIFVFEMFLGWLIS